MLTLDTKYLDARTLCARHSCSRMWLWGGVHHHGFPKPIKLSTRKTAKRFWPLDAVIACERERAAP